MNIIVDLSYPIKDGTEVKFRSPVDCSQVTGLKVNYPNGSQEFAFADAHGNNVGDIDHLFAEDVVVKVILDVTKGMAFVQNADTNAYIERTFIKSVNGKTPDENGNVEVAGGGGGGSPNAVLYTEQTLTEAQQTQARKNIGATLDVLKALGSETKRVDNLDEVTENGFYIGSIPDHEGEWYCIAMSGMEGYTMQLCLAENDIYGYSAPCMIMRITFNPADTEAPEWQYYKFYTNSELDEWLVNFPTYEEIDGWLGNYATYDDVIGVIDNNIDYITQSVIDALPVYEGED